MSRELDEVMLDVLLRERLGGERPPVSTDRILARFARGEGAQAARQVVADEAFAPGRRWRWLAAAIALFGLAIVLATRSWTGPGVGAGAGGGEGSAAAPDRPQEHEPDTSRRNPADGTAAGFALRVVDEHGGPVQECTLDVVHDRRAAAGGAFGTAAFLRTQVRGLALQPRDFDADGFAAIAGQVPGSCRAVVRAAGFAVALSAPFDLVAGAPRPAVTVRLDQGGELTGRVVDRYGGAVAGAEVATATPPDPLDRGSPAGAMFADQFLEVRTSTSVRTATDGTFRLTRLVPGAYWLQVGHAELGARTVTGVDVAVGRQELPPIELAPALVLLGRVVDGGGVPVAAAEVLVVHVGSGRRWTATSDAAGAFRLSGGLVAGDYELRAAPAASQGLTRLVHLAQSSTALTIRGDAGEVAVEIVIR